MQKKELLPAVCMQNGGKNIVTEKQIVQAAMGTSECFEFP
jgi:hypothetical protein